MTNLTAESALESARQVEYDCVTAYTSGMPSDSANVVTGIARARIHTRIEAMQDCASAHCEYCRNGEKPSLLNIAADPSWRHNLIHACAAQYEQSEIRRLMAHIVKLSQVQG